MRIVQTLLLALLFVTHGFAQTPAQFTVEDRERLVRVEEGLKALSKRMDERFASFEQRMNSLEKRMDERFASFEQRMDSFEKRMDENNQSLQRQIDDIKKFLLWGFGILFGGMGILIGFVIWDRRSALQPVATRQAFMEEELRQLTRREAKVEQALKQYGEQEPRMGKIIKSLEL